MRGVSRCAVITISSASQKKPYKTPPAQILNHTLFLYKDRQKKQLFYKSKMKLFVSAALALSTNAFKYKEIVDLYYNEGARTLPSEERGIQWHQCGQNSLEVPDEGRDLMCTGNKCFLVCNRGKNSFRFRLLNTKNKKSRKSNLKSLHCKVCI